MLFFCHKGNVYNGFDRHIVTEFAIWIADSVTNTTNLSHLCEEL